MNIKQLQKIAHKYAVSKGFWGDGAKGGWHKSYYIKNRDVAGLLMLCVSELGEACEALRSNKRQVHYNSKLRDKDWMKDTFEDELADTIIRICDLAEAHDIDLEWQIEQKLKYNKERPEKHGKQF